VANSPIPEVIGVGDLDDSGGMMIASDSVFTPIPHKRASIYDGPPEHLWIQDEPFLVGPGFKGSYLPESVLASFRLGDFFSSPKPLREAWDSICLAVIFRSKESKRACKVLSGVSGG